jgi:hypothetical protein
MDIHFKVGGINIDERKLAEATNSQLIEMYEHRNGDASNYGN